jgi:DNA-binding MarR family transcriptional regulator
MIDAADGEMVAEDSFRTGYLVHEVSRLRRQLYDQQSRHIGITRSQWWLLFNLSCHDGHSPTQNELAQMIDLGSASVGELVIRLERAGFVQRRTDPKDRRAKRVEIANRGSEALERMRQIAFENNERVMAGFSAEEQDLLNQLLSRMKRNLIALQGEASARDTRAASVTSETDGDDLQASREISSGLRAAG